MKIEYYGHASFKITTASGLRIVLDPYEAGGFGGAVGLDPIGEEAEVVLCSHGHADHGHAEAVKGEPEVVCGPGEREVRGIGVLGVKTFHDDEGGVRRGENTVFVLVVDGLKVAHLGDLGHRLSEEQAREIGPVDVLLLPVGGTFTIDAKAAAGVAEALAPRVVIPMHYRNPKIRFPLASVEEFVKEAGGARRIGSARTEFSELPPSREVWILEASR